MGERPDQPRTSRTTLKRLTQLNGIITIQAEDGSISVPNAVQVFEMLSHESTLPGMAIDDSVALLATASARSEVRLVLSVTADTRCVTASPHVRHSQELIDVAHALAVHADHVVLGAEWVPLDSGALADISKIAEQIGSSVWPTTITLKQYFFLLTDTELSWVIEDRTADSLAAEGLGSTGTSALPDVSATLYPYQETGVRWLQRIVAEGVGGILADEMGLGKTLQIISLLSGLRGTGLLPALIVGPASILENWRRELHRFAPALRVTLHRGAGRTGLPAELFSYDVVLSSYETVLKAHSKDRISRRYRNPPRESTSRPLEYCGFRMSRSTRQRTILQS